MATSSRPGTFLRLIWGPARPLDSALPPRKQRPEELLQSSKGWGRAQWAGGAFSASCLGLERTRYRRGWERDGEVGSAETSQANCS